MIVPPWISATFDNFHPTTISAREKKYLYTTRWQYLIYLFIIYKYLGRFSAIHGVYHAEHTSQNYKIF
jgi:hypothetical protein